MEKSKWYFYTQTIAPHLYKETLREETNFILPRVHLLLRKFSKEYDIFIELHKNGHIHLHAVVNVHDIIKMHRIKHKFGDYGFFDLQEVEDMVDTYNYCRKDQKLMQDVLEMDLPVTYGHLERDRSAKRALLKSLSIKSDPIDYQGVVDSMFHVEDIGSGENRIK